MAPHSNTLAWKIPWVEEPGGLQCMGSRRVGHDWVTSLSLFTFMHWRRKWQPTPVFLPRESQGRGSLVGCCLWGCTKLDMTEATYQQQQQQQVVLNDCGMDGWMDELRKNSTLHAHLPSLSAFPFHLSELWLHLPTVCGHMTTPIDTFSIGDPPFHHISLMLWISFQKKSNTFSNLSN